MDPWVIAPAERLRHEEQFRSLIPAPNGMLTGAQARNFFLQSGLPPIVLAQIWGLADVNGDGQMDINEFSLACKMITMKLKGFEVPKTLPTALSMAMAAIQPQAMPPSSLNIMGMPQMQQQQQMMQQRMPAPMGNMMMGGQPQMMQPQVPGMQMPMNSMGMGMQQPNMVMPQANMGMPVSTMGMPISTMGMPVSTMGMGMPVTTMGMGMPVNSMGMGMQQPQMGMGMQPQMGGMVQGMMPQQQMMSVQPNVPMSVASAISSGPGSGASTPGGISMDWAIPQPTRARYSQQFNATDRSRTGFLAGVQARNLLLQSGLPQNILAQVWGLSDVDADGRLSAEEFILAGHLCDIASKGEPLPQVLPPLMIPPSLRKGTAPGVHSGNTPVAATGTPDDSKSFEDRRRENFNKGQAELERRRQSLVDQQKKDEDERKRKEKEEKEERERQKQEMERQRLAEWEKQRKAELMQHRQREQEKVLILKAKHEHITNDLDKLRDKVKSLTDNISDTRSGVTDVKSFIDGMRTSRDTKMQDMTNLKNKLKDQNARLLVVTQEKAKLDAKIKHNDARIAEGRTEELTEFEYKRSEKEKHVIELRERLAKLKEKEEETRQQFENEKEIVSEHREKLKQIISSCKALYDKFDEQRREIKAEKAKRIRELTDPDHAWGADHDKPSLNNSIREPMASLSEGGDTSGYIQYKAIYDFDSRNPDELPFKAGDIIMVHPGQPHEPGWLGGELDGKVGWFPEAYVEKVPDHQAALHTITEENADVIKARALYDWTAVQTDTELSFSKGDVIIVTSQIDPTWWLGKVESGDGSEGYFPSSHVTTEDLDPRGSTPTVAPEVTSQSPQKATTNGDAGHGDAGIMCVALYPYTSEETGDLNFEAGDTIEVVKKDGDWWTGRIGDRLGVFPFNYVQPVEGQDATGTEAIPNGEESLEAANASLPVQEPPEAQSSSDSEKYTGVSWANSASHVAHQVGTFEVIEEPAVEVVATVPQAVSDVVDTAETAVAIEIAAVEKEPVAKRVSVDESTPNAATRVRSRSKSKKRKEEGSESKPAKKPELATVVAPYTATGKEQLTLSRGQMILVRKKTDTGWWQGEIQASKGKKRQVGWFPASYVKLMESSGEKGHAAPTAEPAENGKADPIESAPKFRALFAYAAQNEDELSFQVGDLISLISKDEEAWWRGNLNGNVGVFPSNYVEVVEQNSVADAPAPQVNGKRGHVITELLSTEQNFLEALEIVRDIFINPLRDAKLLDQSELEVIFINWNELIVCSNRLCKSLKIRKKMSLRQDVSIGDILCENLSQMNAYIRFCASQLNSAALLQKLVEVKPGFDEFLRRCQSHARVQGMPLSYYLLKPVKRVTDYPTFVEKLLKNTPSSHPDWGQLNEALTRAKSLCDQVNEGMRHKENSERLEWLQLHVDCRPAEICLDEKLTFNSMTNLMGPRKFLHHGLLRKSKSGKELAAFLFNDFLLLTMPNKPIGPGHQFSFDKHHDTKLKLYRKPIFLNEINLSAHQTSNILNDAFSSTNSSKKGVGSRKASTGFGEIDKNENISETTLGLELSNQGTMVLEALSIHDRTLWLSKLSEAIIQFKEKDQQQKIKKESAIREEMNSSTGRVLVVVVEASDLSSTKQDQAKIDPYCEVSIGSQEHKTHVVKGTFHPKWNSSMQFFIRDVNEDVLCFTVFDKDYFSPNEFLGRTEIRVSDILIEKNSSQVGGGLMTKCLPLYETESGQITVRLDLQLFANE